MSKKKQQVTAANSKRPGTSSNFAASPYLVKSPPIVKKSSSKFKLDKFYPISSSNDVAQYTDNNDFHTSVISSNWMAAYNDNRVKVGIGGGGMGDGSSYNDEIRSSLYSRPNSR